ncbi:hypothetical protein [Thioclava sp. GXIMD4216]|uniref:hypothetical protein n=1 Tax=Thioclava sp. GXIMD4216 TaxID=3131929 RepID=UPI0030D16BB3
MIWVPILFGVFKFGALGATIFLSIKSHRDGEEEERQKKEAAARSEAPLPDASSNVQGP